MATSISSSIIACLKSFNEFIEEIRNFPDKDVRGLVASAWEDELGRLRMWAANIGAHQTGQSSLDFRLRDASHIRQQIIKLLQGLLRRLQNARDVLADDEESDNEAATEDDALNVEDRETQIQELQESLAANVNCLFQMSMLVRKPAQHDFHLSSRGADVAAFEPFDYKHVKEKYPKADDALVKRLGYANTRRRKYLKYRERHATKLRQGIGNVDLGAGDDRDLQEQKIMEHGTRSVLSSTIATELEQRNIDFDDRASDTDISRTSYAPTLLSGGNIAIPPPPKTSLDGVPFECPYCFYVIRIDGVRAWNKHIFQDLQPYICLAPTCTTPDKLYPTRHEWLHHSYMAHPAVMTHDDTTEESKRFVACLLCKETFELGKQHARHLARHLQELSLFVLPNLEQDSDVGGDEGAASSSDSENVTVAISHDGSRSLEGQAAVPIEHQASMEGLDSLYATREKEENDEGDKQHTTVQSTPNQLYEAAARLEELLMETKKRQLGAEHPETLQSMCTLAQTYQKMNQFVKAEALYDQALKGYEKTHGFNHRLTIVAANFLGDIYIELGRLKEAEVMYRRALKGNEETMGLRHPLTLNSITSLGSVYEKLRKLEDAEAMYRRALKIYEDTGPLDIMPSLITSLGMVCYKLGKLKEAEAMYRRALKGKEETIDFKKFPLSSVADGLIKIYRKQGKLAEAEELSKRLER